ncbi:MAG: integration host factor subunit alpha [Pseudomonadota bacterium]
MTSKAPSCTKAVLAEKVHDHVGLSKREAARLVDQFFAEISKTLALGREVKLPHFGTLKTQRRQSRIGRNPQTGKEYLIPTRQVVVFRASPMLKTKLNNPLTKKPHKRR